MMGIVLSSLAVVVDGLDHRSGPGDSANSCCRCDPLTKSMTGYDPLMSPREIDLRRVDLNLLVAIAMAAELDRGQPVQEPAVPAPPPQPSADTY
jgi:hypothetical protein